MVAPALVFWASSVLLPDTSLILQARIHGWVWRLSHELEGEEKITLLAGKMMHWEPNVPKAMELGVGLKEGRPQDLEHQAQVRT